MKRSVFLLGTFTVMLSSSAETVAWWRFEELPCGERATEMLVITNWASPGTLDAYARVSAATQNNQPVFQMTPEDKVPLYTNSISSLYAVADPVSGAVLENKSAVYLASNRSDNRTPSSILIVDDHEKLHLQSQTIEFFLKVPPRGPKTTWETIFAKEYFPSNGSYPFIMRYQSGGNDEGDSDGWLTLTVGEPAYDESGNVLDFNGPGTKTINSKWNFPKMGDDTWHHIAVVFDASAKKIRLFVDYVDRERMDWTWEIPYSNEPFVIGAPKYCYYGNWTGTIDEFRISDEALTPDRFLRTSLKPDPVTDEKTLAYIDFNSNHEDPPTDGMVEALYRHAGPLANRGAHDGRLADDTAVSYGETTSRVVFPSDVVASTVRFGLGGRITADNISFGRFQTNTSSAVTSGRLEIPDPGQRIFSDDCTLEFFFRAPPGEIAYTDVSGANTYLVSRKGGLQIWSGKGEELNLRVNDEKNHKLRFFDCWGGDTARSRRAYNDGQWHHLALVCSKATKVTDLYVDRKLVATGTDMDHVGDDVATAPQSLCFNGGHWTVGASAFQYRSIDFDEIRITRGCLKPYQFLTTYPDAGRLLVHGSFEENLVVEPYEEFYPKGQALATDSGSAPTFAAERPGRFITDGVDGELLLARNRCSLSFNGGVADFGVRDLLSEAKTFTVECFITTGAKSAGAGLLRYGETAGWMLGVGDSDGNLVVSLDTDAEVDQSHIFDGSGVSDGKWHHVAVVFDSKGENVGVSLFRDYRKVGEWDAVGRLSEPVGAGLRLGLASDNAVPFIGVLDELRITSGILTPDRFMRASGPGFTLHFR